MKEFKTLSFVMFDERGRPHKIRVDKLEGEKPDVLIRGDTELLLKRFEMIKFIVEQHLKKASTSSSENQRTLRCD